MAKPTIITGLRVVAAYYKGYGMETITTDKDGMNETHEVHCCVEGWHAGCDDTITMIVKDGIKYIEPAQWNEDMSIDEKVKLAIEHREENEAKKEQDEQKIEQEEAIAKQQNDADIARQKAESKQKKVV